MTGPGGRLVLSQRPEALPRGKVAPYGTKSIYLVYGLVLLAYLPAGEGQVFRSKTGRHGGETGSSPGDGGHKPGDWEASPQVNRKALSEELDLLGIRAGRGSRFSLPQQ
jgi:hypothetical protein